MSGAESGQRRETASAAETEAVGSEIAAGLEPGDLVVVRGGLGAGKTTLIRGACRALGVVGAVTSPTFTIGRILAGRIPVAHVDLYRLEQLGAEEPGLLDDYLREDAVAFVEWPERGAGELPEAAVEVSIEARGGDRRLIAWGPGR